MKPLLLTKGDQIGIAAPAGPFDQKAFLKGISHLKKNFLVDYRKGIFSKKNYLAGDDSRRADELNYYLKSAHSKALLFARGGYGCQRLLPLLKNDIHPKVVIGSSDLTVILNYLWKKIHLPTLYGPMVAPHLRIPQNASRLTRILTRPASLFEQKLIAKKVLKSGKAEGRLIGGCLTLLVSTLGTPWEFDSTNAILFLEDTNEEPYEVDRMLTQLIQAGKMKSVKGIVLGTFRQGKTLFPRKIEAVFKERFTHFLGPILWGLPFGHCTNPLTIPIGLKGRIQGNRLEIIENFFRNSPSPLGGRGLG